MEKHAVAHVTKVSWGIKEGGKEKQNRKGKIHYTSFFPILLANHPWVAKDSYKLEGDQWEKSATKDPFHLPELHSKKEDVRSDIQDFSGGVEPYYTVMDPYNHRIARLIFLYPNVLGYAQRFRQLLFI